MYRCLFHVYLVSARFQLLFVCCFLDVTSVRGLWVYSKDGGLWVQWDADSTVSEFVVERMAVAEPNDTQLTWIRGSGHVLTNLRGLYVWGINMSFSKHGRLYALTC